MLLLCQICRDQYILCVTHNRTHVAHFGILGILYPTPGNDSMCQIWHTEADLQSTLSQLTKIHVDWFILSSLKS